MTLFDMARRVKAGVRLLDRKIPNWRTVLRRHEDEFDFADGSHCVLGTLEHYSGRMRTLIARRQAKQEPDPFWRAAKALGVEAREEDLGFEAEDVRTKERDMLAELWRAEFAAK